MPTLTYTASKPLLTDRNVVQVTATGQLTRGVTGRFRFIVPVKSEPGLDAKLEVVFDHEPGMHTDDMVPASFGAELRLPDGYDRVFVIYDAEQTVVLVPIIET